MTIFYLNTFSNLIYFCDAKLITPVSHMTLNHVNNNVICRFGSKLLIMVFIIIIIIINVENVFAA